MVRRVIGMTRDPRLECAAALRDKALARFPSPCGRCRWPWSMVALRIHFEHVSTGWRCGSGLHVRLLLYVRRVSCRDRMHVCCSERWSSWLRAGHAERAPPAVRPVRYVELSVLSRLSLRSIGMYCVVPDWRPGPRGRGYMAIWLYTVKNHIRKLRHDPYTSHNSQHADLMQNLARLCVAARDTAHTAQHVRDALTALIREGGLRCCSRRGKASGR